MTAPGSQRAPTRALLPTLSVLLGSLLLFGMEPMVGRLLVPLYGSAVSTWLTALMFFQVVLFFGYLYAHLVAPRIGAGHLLVLIAAAPFVPLAIQGEVVPEAPMGHIVMALVRHIGVPFFLLSTGAVVVQVWWARSALGQEREPYPLYAASNTGSLLALIGYPFLIEPLMGLSAQSRLWTAGFVLYVLCLAATWWSMRPERGLEPVVAGDEPRPSLGTLATWALLAAMPSGFLLAVTSVIATEVGSFPMVWILPLAVYLGTFVLLFRDRPIGIGIRGYWPEIAALGLLGYVVSGLTALALLAGHLVLFFLYSMAVHGELYARRPSPRWLTVYYLAISFGGGVGGAVVNFLPPVLFDGFWEYPLLMLLFGATFAALCGRELARALQSASRAVASLRMVVFQGALGIALFGLLGFWNDPPLEANRNFYGVFRVVDRGPQRLLVHGATQHGGQYIDPARRHEVTAYAYVGGGVQSVFAAAQDLGADHYAVLGLGAGVFGAYLQADDVLDFYEIDPSTEGIARRWFTWLEDSPASIRVLLGDGRLKLQAFEPERPYDVVFLDAFSGDGIPTHLLTVEAVEVYQSRLAADGLLVFHVSNRYYDLRPVVQALGEAHGLTVLYNPTHSGSLAEPEYWPSVVAIATRSEAAIALFTSRGWHRARPEQPVADHPWTDDYINILQPLYWRRTTRDWPSGGPSPDAGTTGG